MTKFGFSKHSCRLCKSDNVLNLIQLHNFPKAAQFFLDEPIESGKESVILDVLQCSKCGLVQLGNEPVDYFKDVITAASLSPASKQKISSEWSALIEKYQLKSKKLLEVGAGRGDFLEVMLDLDFDVVGLENSSDNLAHCHNKGLSVKAGYLTEVEFEHRYDLIVCNNFLEHQPDIEIFINKFHSSLEREGYIYISVPNIKYLIDKGCLYEFVADHLVYFDRRSLNLAFSMNGFEILEEYEKNNGNDLVIFAKRRELLNLDKGVRNVKSIVESLKSKVSNAKAINKRIAVWGAGHRALALMAISNLDAIDFIVDSAQFKQNKYSPILHKKIISPEALVEIGCDLLIVMLPGDYSEQIKKFISQAGLACEVIIFKDEILDKGEMKNG
jgi:2-polyprenyl-3-methyl-5-hydroxy-6-metoxy-1,4-benzoquinol methylase